MDNIIVADSSPLIAFGRIDNIALIYNTLGTIIVPEIVAQECLGNLSKPGASNIQQAINKKMIKIKTYTDGESYKELIEILGKGEAAAISLAAELQLGILIDEKLGRHVAEKMKLKIIGTGGVLLLAKQKQIIKKVKPIIEQLKHAGYYLSHGLINVILKKARE